MLDDFKKFRDYLWHLAHKVIKGADQETSDTYKLFSACGKVLDDLKQAIFEVRRQAFILTAKGKGLDAIGRVRRMHRYPDETDEQYAERLISKREISEYAGTAYGLSQSIRSLGYNRVKIVPVYLDDPARWAEFYVFLNKVRLNQLNNFEIVQRTVREVKKASSKPNYVFTYYANLQVGTATRTITKKITYCGQAVCGRSYV